MATWDSQSGPIISTFGSLLQMQILGPYPRPIESEILVVSLGVFVLKSLLGDPSALENLRTTALD